MVKRVDDISVVSEHVLRDLDGLLRRSGADMPLLFAARAQDDPDLEGVRGGAVRLLDLLGDGRRLSDLARAAGVTKQAVGERVRDLEARGLVTTTPDPTDGRAVVVRRTPHGDDALRATLRAIGDLEAAWSGQVGAERYAVFREVLADLAGGHRLGSPPAGRPGRLGP